jgi:CheY-like chemotaxis protein
MSLLSGTRVLVVEDEAILSLTLQDMLVDLGCVIAGTAARLEAALHMLNDTTFDVALLDVNLNGQRVDPLAQAISARGTPIIFVTGYGQAGISAGMSGLVMEKPYDEARLEQVLARALGTARV